MIWFLFFLLIAGLGFVIFGFRVLFEKGYVEKLRQGIWKSVGDDNPIQGRQGYTYDKYWRGGRYLMLGLLFLGAAIYGFLKTYGII